MGRVGLIIGLLIFTGFRWSVAASKDTVNVSIERDPKTLERERLDADRAEIKHMRLVDSVGWEKVKAIRQPAEPMAQLEKEQLQRKMSALIGFCNEAHFAKVADVDSLKELTAEEKVFCKDRLKIINPTLP
jgi:hypothetical protein